MYIHRAYIHHTFAHSVCDTMCLVICYCVGIVVKLAPWCKCFACVHSEVLLCAMSAVSIVTTEEA